MKMINKILYIIFGVGTVFLLLGCMFHKGEKRDIFVEDFRSSKDRKETKIVTKEFEIKDKKIGFECIDSDVVIREGNGDHIKIEYDENAYEEPLIVDNNQIQIKVKKSYFGSQKLVGFVFLSYWGEMPKSVEITLPKEMYQEITGNIVGSEVEIKSLNMNKMDCNIRNSLISMSDCEIKNEVALEGNNSNFEMNSNKFGKVKMNVNGSDLFLQRCDMQLCDMTMKGDNNADIDDGTFGKLVVHSNNSVGEFNRIYSKNVKIYAEDSNINLSYHENIDSKNLKFISGYMEGDYEVKNGKYYVKKNEKGVLLELEMDEDSCVEIE